MHQPPQTPQAWRCSSTCWGFAVASATATFFATCDALTPLLPMPLPLPTTTTTTTTTTATATATAQAAPAPATATAAKYYYYSPLLLRLLCTGHKGRWKGMERGVRAHHRLA